MARILIVDDDLNNRRFFGIVLKNHDIAEAASGMEALGMIGSFNPDLVILDQRMPEMDGLMTLDAINRQYPKVRCVMITAEGTLALAIEAMKAGALDFITKPVDIQMLQHTVQKALEFVRLTREHERVQEELKEQQNVYQQKLEAEVAARTKEANDARIKAEEANRIKTKFLANMSHELRTPMHGILSFAKFGIDRINTVDKDQLLVYFKAIRGSGERLLGMLNGLLDLSKLESGKVVYQKETISLRDIVRKSITEMASFYQEKQVTILLEEGHDDDNVSVDAARLTQVVHNLLSNAVKYSSIGARVIVTVKRCAEGVECCVIDQGVGIAPDDLETIFDPFVQSSKSRNAAGGIGLGLAITREIILDHGGRIWALNNPSGGAKLTFILPDHR